MKHRLFTLLFALLAATASWAVPALRGTFTHTQKDGTVLTLSLVGDEYQHYYINTATNEKMLRGQDGDFYVVDAATVDAQLRAAKARRAAANRRRLSRAKAPAKIGSVTPMTGHKKGIVILVNFSDKAMTTGTQTAFNNMFNQQGYNSDGHIGSVADYFKAQSYGQFELSFDVVGPVTLSNNMAYYGGNDSDGNDRRPAQMAKEACQLADNAGVDFSQYDWDDDGYVDQVFIIYAGYGENYSGSDANTIWPHEWDLSSSGAGAYRVDGVTVKTYACCAELYGTKGSTLNGMGTACHEFSHCLGYPDSYDIDYSGGIGMDCYDLMCSGSYNGPNGRGEVPSGYTAFQRWMAGWLEPTELSEPTNVTGMKDLGSEGKAYVIYNNSNRNEFFMLENRQSNRWFQYYKNNTAGHGLFITHIDFNQTVWNNNEPNDDPSHQRLAWVPADKNYGSYSSSNKSWSVSSTEQKGDYFPGTSSVTSFKPTASAWNTTGGKWFTAENGSYYTNHELSQITENTTAGTISFLFDGGDDGSRYTVTYNAGAGTCETASWTQTTSSRQATTLPTCTIDSKEWTFAGWTTASVEQTTKKPSTLLKAGDSYKPTSNVTLYAVYTKNEDGGEDASYTLDWSSESSLQSKSLGYGNATEYTATDGSKWVIKAYKNNGMQINNGKDATIKVPECPSNISSVVVSFNTNRTLGFSTTDYSSFTKKATSTTSGSTATIDLSGLGLTTGYIYSTDGSTVITKIVVNYGGSGTTYYATNPVLTVLPTPTISFAQPNESGKAMLVGDTYTNVATATCPGVTLPAVTYASSKPEVATVDASGMVTALATGTTTITATVAAVDGKSKAASVSYTINVTMPTLSSIAVTTPPTKKDYTENEDFAPTGMVVTATYSNGYTAVIPQKSSDVNGYTITPTTMSLGTTPVTISYTEAGVTQTTTVDGITVTALPRYTVTFNPGTGTCATTSLTEGSYQGGVTLPTCTAPDSDWSFAGWATSSVSTATTTAPTLLYAGAIYPPTTDITLYAVYKMTEGEGKVWKKVAASAVNTAGTYALITTDGHAFNGTISSGHGQVTSTAFSFDSKGEAASAPEGTCELTLAAVTGGYTMYSEGNGYLYASAASSGKLAWHNTESSYWLYKSSNWLYNSNSAYLRDYQNVSFRTYGSNNGSVVQFAQKISSSTTTYHSTPAPASPLESIAVTTPPTKTTYTEGESFNPDGMVVTATFTNGTTATLSLATEGTSGYTYSPTAPLSTTDTKVTISYTKGDVTKTVTVSITVNPLPKYTVTFDAGEHGHCETSFLQEASHGSGVVLPDVAPSAGFVFKGWATASDVVSANAGAAGVNYKPSSNIVLYAVYAPVYAAKFFVNGSQTGDTQWLEEGAAIVFPVEEPESINGKLFMGWSGTTIETPTDTKPAFITEATMGKEDVAIFAVYAQPSAEGGETTEVLSNDVIASFSESDALAYTTEKTYTDGSVNYTIYAYADKSRKWIQLKKDAGVYVKISAPSAITNVTVTLTSSSNSTGGVNDITKHNAFSGTVALCASDCAYSTSSSSVASTNNLVDNVATLKPSGSNNELYLKVSSGARIWSLSVTYGTPATYSGYTTQPSLAFTPQSLSLQAHTTDDVYYATFSNRESVTFFPDDVVVETVAVGPQTGILSIIPIETKTVTIADKEVTGCFVPANTGVLIHTTAALDQANDNAVTYYTVSGKSGVTLPGDNSGNMLLPGTGSETAKPADADGDYLFYKLAYGNYTDETGLGFWWGADNGAAFVSREGLAYLAVPKSNKGTSAPSNAMGFTFSDDGETAIAVVRDNTTAASRPTARPVYDLNGRRVLRPGKGIYIIDGRKVVR